MTSDAATPPDAPPGTQASTTTPSPPPPDGPPERVGILFIHGMGEFRRGDTLRRFGEPIYAWLDSWRAWCRAEPTLFADDTSLRLPHLDDPDAPPHTRITITWPESSTSKKRTQTWIAAEGWWSDEFTPPAFSEVASWSMALAPGMLVRFFRASMGRSRWWGWAALPLGYLAAGLFQVLLMALVIVGMVPPLRRYVARVQVVLTGVLGDPLVMVASPIRFNAILSRIERNIEWLREQQCCQRIAVVAHSQGTGIGLRVLQRRSKDVTLFVTFGTAIEKLHIAAELQAIRRRLGIAITASSACLVLVGALWILTTIEVISTDGGFLGIDFAEQPIWLWAIVSVAVMLVVGIAITRWSGRQIAKVNEPDLTVPVLGKDGGTTEPAPLIWHDFWSVSDPFPDKGLPNIDSTGNTNRPITRRSWQIVNRADVFKDHSLYEENHEGFVGPVFAALAQFAELDHALPEHLGQTLTDAELVRQRRVAALGFARLVAIGAASLLPLLSLARGELGTFGRPLETALIDVSAWLGIQPVVDAIKKTDHLDEIIGALLVVVLVFAWYRLAIMQGWLIWDKAEADLLAIERLKLPVAAGPYILNAGRLDRDGGLSENKTPGEIAALDRVNGVWIFVFAALALPAAFLVMSFVKADWDGYTNEPLRWSIAVAVLLVSATVLLWPTHRALGGWVRPFRAPAPTQEPR